MLCVFVEDLGDRPFLFDVPPIISHGLSESRDHQLLNNIVLFTYHGGEYLFQVYFQMHPYNYINYIYIYL